METLIEMLEDCSPLQSLKNTVHLLGFLHRFENDMGLTLCSSAHKCSQFGEPRVLIRNGGFDSLCISSAATVFVWTGKEIFNRPIPSRKFVYSPVEPLYSKRRRNYTVQITIGDVSASLSPGVSLSVFWVPMMSFTSSSKEIHFGGLCLPRSHVEKGINYVYARRIIELTFIIIIMCKWFVSMLHSV